MNSQSSSVESLGNDGVLQKQIKGYDLQRVFMCRLKNNRARRACLLYLQPSCRADTPAVARFQPRETILWHWSRKIIAETGRGSEKVFGHNTADGVHANIFRPSVAAAVAIEAGHRLGAAGFQRLTQYILLN